MKNRKMKIKIIFLTTMVFLGCTSKMAIIKGDINNLGDKDVALSVRDSNLSKTAIVRTRSVGNKFTIKQKVTTPQYAYLVMNGGNQEVRFVLEPGVITVRAEGRDTPIVSGTKHNDLLYQWRYSPEAKQNDSMRHELDAAFDKSDYTRRTPKEQNEVRSKYMEGQYIESKLERLSLNEMYSNGDARVKLFAMISNYTWAKRKMSVIDSLETIVGKSFEIDYLKKRFADELANFEQSRKTEIGKPYLEILAERTSGESVRLSEVVAKNRLTMLEFWASWCAPCRGEIPAMKKVYDDSRERGFEIFSFSIDRKKEAWLKASTEENFKWINTRGDVDEVQKQYVVESVPMNLLIDSRGVIVAKNLRGDALNEFVSEFLNQ